MKKSELKALIKEVIEELAPEMAGSPENPATKKYAIQSQGLGMYHIIDLDTKKTVKSAINWKGIKQKWKEVTGQEWVEEPYES